MISSRRLNQACSCSAGLNGPAPAFGKWQPQRKQVGQPTGPDSCSYTLGGGIECRLLMIEATLETTSLRSIWLRSSQQSSTVLPLTKSMAIRHLAPKKISSIWILNTQWTLGTGNDGISLLCPALAMRSRILASPGRRFISPSIINVCDRRTQSVYLDRYNKPVLFWRVGSGFHLKQENRQHHRGAIFGFWAFSVDRRRETFR